MISVPIAVNNALFQWQLELWWWNQKRLYGKTAYSNSLAIVIEQNYTTDPPYPKDWLSVIPHVLVPGVCSEPVSAEPTTATDLPLNIQIGLKQVLAYCVDETVIELMDCDMFHLKPAPDMAPADNELLVCDLYEAWHLASLSTNRYVIEPYFENKGQHYNGGFVPIVGKAKTFKRLIAEWEAVHRDILLKHTDASIRWWAGMFALQAACEKKQVKMTGQDSCYIPGYNNLADSHYAVHYSVDREAFPKYSFPDVDFNAMPSNVFYDQLKAWYLTSSYAATKGHSWDAQNAKITQKEIALGLP